MTVTNIYADGEDVQALLNALGGPALTLGAGSTPTLTQTEEWLDQVAADVDGMLLESTGSHPESGDTQDILRLKRYIAQKVAALVFHAGFMFDELPDKIGIWEDEYKALLERIENGGFKLQSGDGRAKVGSVIPQRYRGS